MLKRLPAYYLPESNVQSAVQFLNRFDWNIALFEIDGNWIATEGDQMLVEATSEAERDAFIIGMATALRPLPESILADIRSLALAPPAPG